MAEDRVLALGIETSCDDTACAVVDNEGRVLSSVVSSQLAAHRPYGGVVPEIASREHLRNWPPVSEAALQQAGVTIDEIDVISATRGPGLIGSLLVGLSIGKAIAYSLKKSFQAVHHLEGHLYSPFLRIAGDVAEKAPEKFLGLVVSGGHTSIFQVESGSAVTLAETRDDAMGEVFDKVGKRLGLAYPQGPRVDELAELGDGRAVQLAIARCSDGSLDFSYSGLKSQALLEIQKLEATGVVTHIGDLRTDAIPQSALDLLAGFRVAAVEQIIDRLARLLQARPIDMLAVSGGVAANRLLRRRLEEWAQGHQVNLRLVPMGYAGDNAAMIAHAALLRRGWGREDDPLTADAASRISI